MQERIGVRSMTERLGNALQPEKVLRRPDVLEAKGSLYTILDTDFGERLYFYELR